MAFIWLPHFSSFYIGKSFIRTSWAAVLGVSYQPSQELVVKPVTVRFVCDCSARLLLGILPASALLRETPVCPAKPARAPLPPPVCGTGPSSSRPPTRGSATPRPRWLRGEGARPTTATSPTVAAPPAPPAGAPARPTAAARGMSDSWGAGLGRDPPGGPERRRKRPRRAAAARSAAFPSTAPDSRIARRERPRPRARSQPG